jgi:hypothetical protein
MRLADAYRQLDLDPAATEIEIKRAHRELTKVWHPDRFGQDLELRQRASEKLKVINEAYETIVASRASTEDLPDPDAWRVRSRGREQRVSGLEKIVTMVDDGTIGEEAEVFDPAVGEWTALTAIPTLATTLARRRVRRNRNYAITCALIAIFILLRRPVPGGVIVALVLFGLAFLFVARMRP